MLDVLLGSDADVNAKSYGGYTPLHLAAQAGQVVAYNRLLAAGIYIYLYERVYVYI